MDRAELENLAAALDTLHRRRQSDRIAGRLIDFVKLMWHVTDPGRPFVEGWPVSAICEHAEAVVGGQIRRLLISVPPGFNKSTSTGVFMPAWCWGPCARPETRFIAASYSGSLTVRDNIRFRRVITDRVYQEYWGDIVQPSDQFNTIKVENSRMGFKLATSVSGVGTGERSDIWIIDDPNSVKEAESETVREATNMWFREVVPDRLNDQATGAIIVIQQRTHEMDVTGVALAENLGYEHLMIPMEYDPKRHCVTSIGWEDPREDENELAWPERFPREVLEELKIAKGRYAWAAQYQQLPVPRGGGIFDRDWFRIYPEEGEEFDPETQRPLKPLQYPPFEYLCASVDTAYETKRENDWSACVVLGVWREPRAHVSRVMIVEAWHARLEFHDLITKIMDTCGRYRVDALLVEAKASGISVAQEMVRLCSGRDWTVIPVQPKGDKIARAYAVQGFVQSGVVYAPDRAWSDLLLDELCSMPRGAHDDLADAAVHGFTYLRQTGMLQMTDESAAEYAASQMYRSPTPSIATEYEDN